MMFSRMVFVILLVIFIAIGYVVSPTAATPSSTKVVPIQDIQSLAGKWWGKIEAGTAAGTQVNPEINKDGTYKASSRYWEVAGTITQVADGKARFKNERGQTGTIMLYERDGVHTLEFERDDGTSKSTYTRVK